MTVCFDIAFWYNEPPPWENGNEEVGNGTELCEGVPDFDGADAGPAGGAVGDPSQHDQRDRAWGGTAGGDCDLHCQGTGALGGRTMDGTGVHSVNRISVYRKSVYWEMGHGV